MGVVDESWLHSLLCSVVHTFCWIVNFVLFQSNCIKCWTTKIMNTFVHNVIVSEDRTVFVFHTYCSTSPTATHQSPLDHEMLRLNSTQIHVTRNDPMVSSTPWDATSKQHSDPRHYEQSNGVQYFLRCYVQTAHRSTTLWTIQWCPVLPEVLRPNSTQIHVSMNDPMVSSTPCDATSKQHSDPCQYELSVVNIIGWYECCTRSNPHQHELKLWSVLNIAWIHLLKIFYF